MAIQILCIAGPTASGKSSRAVEEALARDGEVISVDSRQVYRGLDIGTEKITKEDMRGVPHHLIDIRDPDETYSAGDFVADATRMITEITARKKLPILVGGTHFYFNALLNGLPARVDANPALRDELEKLSTEELYAQIMQRDPRRATALDPSNRRRLIRALEIVASLGSVPPQSGKVKLSKDFGKFNFPDEAYEIKWIVIDPPREELRARIDARLTSALERGLVDEVHRIREYLANHNFCGRRNYGYADTRLKELGLEYKIVGEFLNLGVGHPSLLGCPTPKLLLSTLSAKLWQYARRQKAWLRKLRDEHTISAEPSHPDRS